MSRTNEVLQYLYGLQKFGMKLGLSNIRTILRESGNPHRLFPSIHVAGTNGKGSTSSLIAAILISAGYRVGLYTSPHLVRFNERIRIAGREMSDDDLVSYAERIRPVVDRLNATFFEATTAIAFLYFADKKVDIAVVETGLGGRLDATNVLRPIVSVITSIGLDHIEQLGPSIASIAAEKGGIIKRRVPCVVGGLNEAARRVIGRIARDRSAEVLVAVKSVRTRWVEEGRSMIVRTKSASIAVRPGLRGAHQTMNLRCAVAAANVAETHGFRIEPIAIARGAEHVAKLTGLRGRLELIRELPPVLLDVAHNPAGVRQVIRYVQSLRARTIRLVFGVMRDKDYRGMIRLLKTLNPTVYAVSPEMERSLPLTELEKELVRQGCRSIPCRSIEEGVKRALRNQRTWELVLITGSHYVAGEALQFFNHSRWKNKP